MLITLDLDERSSDLTSQLRHNPRDQGIGVNPRAETVVNDTRAIELKFTAFITSRG